MYKSTTEILMSRKRRWILRLFKVSSKQFCPFKHLDLCSLLQRASLSGTYLLHISTLMAVLFLLQGEGIDIFTSPWLNAQYSWQPAWRDDFRSHIPFKILLSNFLRCLWCWPAVKKDYTTPMNCPYVLIIKRKIF